MKAYRGSKQCGKEFVNYLRCHSEERGITAKCRNKKRSLLDSLIAAAFLRCRPEIGDGQCSSPARARSHHTHREANSDLWDSQHRVTAHACARGRRRLGLNCSTRKTNRLTRQQTV